MKKFPVALLALSLTASFSTLAAETPATAAPVPAVIANHQGPVRIAVIRNLGSDDNTTQFVSGVLEEGKTGIQGKHLSEQRRRRQISGLRQSGHQPEIRRHHPVTGPRALFHRADSAHCRQRHQSGGV